ncbi:alanine--tRNA ligase [Vulcanisaeta sp. JCM 14467]
MEELRTRLFEGMKFYRRQCPYCKHYFWTLNKDQETCGDQPCTPYLFIGNPPGKFRPESIRDVRERFLSFFERHGHVRIKRYPVVARWRSDVYLVGASIYDFQPWVTEGIVPPPANPLTLSQPSIRFTDIDKVGRSGRHLTGFEMMAHHAFNYPDKHVYWIDETVEYAHEFFTKELGLRDDEITYKENIWEGGGNAGECLEVLVGGLEIATLVFMHYRTVNGKYVEMPMKIVDTGYGLERIYWLLTGKPTVYDAVFGPFIEKLRSRLGLPKPSNEMLMHMATYFGQLDPEVTSIEKAYEYIAGKVGMDVNEVRNILKAQETLYILSDHGRTLSWMMADGVIPSNSGVGYLGRLLLRRMLRSMYVAGIEMPLTEIMNIELEFLRDDYPEVYEERQTILELVDLEEKKFKELLRQAPSIIDRVVRDRERRTGKRELTVDDLMMLYDSQGLPPEVVREVASTRLGLSITVPDDFYSRLAARYQRQVGEEKPKVDINPVEVQDLPQTRELFYENMRLFQFNAKVLRVIKNKYVVLDQTAFYPEGGGQVADHGVIKHSRGEARVVDVQRVGPVIVHVIEGEPPMEGETVEGIVDAIRRLDLMRMHTATHILLQSIRRVLGRHVWQAGAEKNVPFSRLDVTHYKLPSRDEIRKIEELANQMVLANYPVIIRWLGRTEAESKFGVYIYQGGAVPGAKLRIVQVGPDENPYDVEACGGMHVSSTGEIGMIKIVRVEKIQEGVVRFIFTTGRHALNYAESLEDSIGEVSELIGKGREDMVKGVKELLNDVSKMEGRIKALTKKAVKGDIAEAMGREVTINGVGFTYMEYEGEDRGYMQEFAKEYLSTRPNTVLLIVNRVGNGTEYMVYISPEMAKRISIRDLMTKLNTSVNGKGGGSTTYGQGFTQGRPPIDTFINIIKAFLGSIGSS